MGVTAAVAAVSAGAAIYQGIQANKANKDAKKEANTQIAQNQAAQDQLVQQNNDQNSQAAANAARDAAKKRQQMLAASAQGPSSTILTSPSGYATPSATATKTLLGG